MGKIKIVARILQALQDCGIEDTMCMDENTVLESVGVDYLDRTQIGMDLETSFGVEIGDEDCFEVKTIGELADIVIEKMKKMKELEK